jgi:hypothetical protein
MNKVIAPVQIINFQGYNSDDIFTGSSALTGYTLPITPFTFKASFNYAKIEGLGSFDYIVTEFTPDYITTEPTAIFRLITELSNTQYISDKRVVWDFGDGTYSTELTSTHYYKSPGVYNISTYFFDSSGGVYKNTTIPSVTCFNIIEDTFNVSVSAPYLTSNQYILTAGRIRDPFSIYTQSSWQTPGSGDTYNTTIGLRLLSGTKNFFDQKLDQNKYGHLYPFSSFYDIDDDGYFVEIQEAVIERTPIYCALSSTAIPPFIYFTTSDTISSVMCGVSGSKDVYVKDDKSGDREITVFDKSFNYNNTIPIIISCSFIDDVFANFAFSSNGITGEGSPINTFEIDPIKYVGQKINFIVTLKDNEYFTIKNQPNLTLNSITSGGIYLGVLNSSGQLDSTLGTFNTNFTYLSSITGGFYRGTFTPSTTAENIRLAATSFASISGTLLTLDDLSIVLAFDDDTSFLVLDDLDINKFSLSNTFNVYASGGKNKIAKINEDFNFSGTLNSLRYQEFLLDKNVLFDDFLGTAFGDSSADPMAPGKLAYEKIANFTSNNNDIYKSNIEGLLSMNSMVGGTLDVYDTTSFNSPSKLKRLTDIVSINHSRLWGSKNQFNENFNNIFGADTSIYGVNLGAKLDFLTTTLTSGNDGYIIALEKFSNKFTKYSTFITLISTDVINPSLSTYALSSYNNTWGWNLLLTPNITGEAITNYYDFYEFVNTPENSHYNNVINFNDPYTTIQYTNSSYNDWVKRGGIVEEMIDYILYTGTGVLSS